MPRPTLLCTLCLGALLAAPAAPLRADDLSAFERKAEMNPDDPKAQFNYGYMAFKAKQLDKAEAAMKRAVKLAPKDAEAWELYGTVLGAAGKTEEAREAFESSAAADPKRVSAWAQLGKAWLAKGPGMDEGKALAAFEKAVKLAPADGRMALNVGLLQLRLGQDAKAAATLEKASKLKGGEAAGRSLCLAYNKAGDFKKALQACGKAAKADPDADTYYNLGFAQIKAGKSAEARKSFESALKLDSAHAPSAYNLGFLDYEAGNPEAALKHFRAAVQAKGGDHADAQYNLAVVLGDLGRWEEAAETYRALLKKDPDNEDAKANFQDVVATGSEALLNQGKDAYERGDFAAARKSWEAVLKLDAANEQAAAFLKRVKAGNERQASAQTASKAVRAQVATRLKAEDAKVRKDGLAAFKAGKIGPAVRLLDFYLKKNPKDAEVSKALFKARSQLRRDTDELLAAAARELVAGNKAAAKDQASKALVLDPGNARAEKLLAQASGASEAAKKSSAEELRTQYYKGVDMYLEGDLDQALQVWKRILAENPEHLDARRSVAQAEVELAALKKRGK